MILISLRNKYKKMFCFCLQNNVTCDKKKRIKNTVL